MGFRRQKQGISTNNSLFSMICGVSAQMPKTSLRTERQQTTMTNATQTSKKGAAQKRHAHFLSLTAGLKVVVQTEAEVVAVELEAEAVLAPCTFVIVSISVTEETYMSNKRKFACEVYLHTGLDANLPAVH